MALAILLVAWNISPSMGGNMAPPMIAITIKDLPSFVFEPSSLIPSANIVGNIKDMNALVRALPRNEQPMHSCSRPGEESGGRAWLGKKLSKKLVTNHFEIGENSLKDVGRLLNIISLSFKWIQRISKQTGMAEMGLKIPCPLRDVPVRFRPSAPYPPCTC